MFLQKNLSVEEMVLISLDSVLRKKRKCSFGDLVKESFRLFPDFFSLSETEEWPDSLKLDRPLRKLREKGYITGSPITYYSLTRFGQAVVNSLRVTMGEKRLPITPKKPTRSPDLALLQEISKGEDFLKFLQDKRSFKPNNMRIREATKSTLETPWQAVRDYLKHLEQIATELRHKDLVEYLKICESFIKKGAR